MTAAWADINDRTLEVARQLRAAAEETRRTLLMSRNLVERSRQQTRVVANPPGSVPSPCSDDPGPSVQLVECLILAYELAQDDAEPKTRVLLGHVLNHVGRRVATVIDPKAAVVLLH